MEVARMKRMTLWGRDENDESLIEQVIRQVKTVTCTPKIWYYDNPGEEPTQVGDRVRVYNRQGVHRCTIEITENYELPFGRVDERIARGEHCADIAEFRADHAMVWQADLEKEGYSLSDDLVIVVEHFRLISVEPK
jgi:uncharacterized protein YhfF